MMGLATELAISLSGSISSRGQVEITRILKHPRKILCLPAQDDGEVLMALPAIRSLRRHYREALLCLFLSEEKRGLWHFDDEVDEVIEFRPDLMKGITSKEFRRIYYLLRQRHFDLILDLNYRPQTLWCYLLSSSRPQVFLGMQHPAVDKFRNLIVRDRSLPRDEVQRNLSLLRVLGIEYHSSAVIWPKLADSEGKREFREKLKNDGLRKHQTVLALDGGAWERRQIQDFLSSLDAKHKLVVLLIGGPPIGTDLGNVHFIHLESPAASEQAEAIACSHGFIGVKNDLFSMAYLLKVPSVIAVPDGSRGLPAEGPHFRIVPVRGRVTFPQPAAKLLLEELAQREKTERSVPRGE